jgi:hypothetical protein
MTERDRVTKAANEIEMLLLERLNGPREAAKTLLMAHVALTKSEGFDREAVNQMLTEYWHMFRTAYFGAEQ